MSGNSTAQARCVRCVRVARVAVADFGWRYAGFVGFTDTHTPTKGDTQCPPTHTHSRSLLRACS